MDRTSDTFNDGLITDQMGRSIALKSSPQRIISLVPSITEYLVDLGLEDRLVGRTKFCIHPAEKVKGITKVGGTKKFDHEKIHELQPDLIIGNKEENYQEGIEELAAKYPVWMSDILNLEQNFEMMSMLGIITGKRDEAASWIRKVRRNFARYRKKYSGRVIYMIWKKPYMVAGRGTFINSILEYLGYENAVLQKRYPEIDEYILRKLSADRIFLSSEPFPFKESHKEEIKSLFPESLTQLVDGEAFSWYGSRLAKVNFEF